MKKKVYLLLLPFMVLASCSDTNSVQTNFRNYNNVENKDTFFDKQNNAILNCIFFKESISTKCSIDFKNESLVNTYLNDKLTAQAKNNNDVDYVCYYDKSNDLSYSKSTTSNNSVMESMEDSSKTYASNNKYEEKMYQIGLYGDENKEYLIAFNLLDNTYYEVDEKSDNIVSSYVFTYALSFLNSLLNMYADEFNIDDEKNIYFVDENIFTIKFEYSKYENVTYNDIVGYKDSSEYAIVQYVTSDDKLLINCYIEENETTNYSKDTHSYLKGNKVVSNSTLSLFCEFDVSTELLVKQDINNFKYKK